MTNEDLLSAMSEMDPAMLQETDRIRRKQKKAQSRTVVLLLVASLFLLLAAGGIVTAAKLRESAVSASSHASEQAKSASESLPEQTGLSETDPEAAEQASEGTASDPEETKVEERWLSFGDAYWLCYHKSIQVTVSEDGHASLYRGYELPHDILTFLSSNPVLTVRIRGDNGEQESVPYGGDTFFYKGLSETEGSFQNGVITYSYGGGIGTMDFSFIGHQSITVSADLTFSEENYDPSGMIRVEFSAASGHKGVLFTIDLLPRKETEKEVLPEYRFGIKFIENIPPEVTDTMEMNRETLRKIVRNCGKTYDPAQLYVLKPFSVNEMPNVDNGISSVRWPTDSEMLQKYLFPVVSGDEVVAVISWEAPLVYEAQDVNYDLSALKIGEEPFRLWIFREYNCFNSNQSQEIYANDGLFDYSTGAIRMEAVGHTHESTDTVFMDLSE